MVPIADRYVTHTVYIRSSMSKSSKSSKVQLSLYILPVRLAQEEKYSSDPTDYNHSVSHPTQ